MPMLTGCMGEELLFWGIPASWGRRAVLTLGRWGWGQVRPQEIDGCLGVFAPFPQELARRFFARDAFK